MPVPLTFPGVYVEEVGSGVHTITGVATSIAAFLGRAERGPVNKATTITSVSDFVRNFGPPVTPLGRAIEDFFLNGGSQAVVARLYHAAAGNVFARLAPGALPLRAWTQGTWANVLVAAVDLDTDPAVATRFGVAAGQVFNLIVTEAASAEAAARIATDKAKPGDVVAVETIRNLTVLESPRRYDRALKAESRLVRADLPDPYVAPTMPAKGVAQVGTPAVADIDLTPNDFLAEPRKGLHALDEVDLFNILCIPPYDATQNVDPGALVDAAALYCEARRAVLLLDAPIEWTDANLAVAGITAGVGTVSKNAAIYFPRYLRPGPAGDAVSSAVGAVAGVLARTDAERGVWKAPAGIETTLRGVPRLSVHLTDAENGLLNPLGVNCLREFPATGRVVWGARTMQGNDGAASEWKYLPVRRTALFIEESLFRGTKWVVFEPNDEPLWAQIRLNIGAFLNGLFRQGAFKGQSPRDAYFVKCDKETTTQNDIDRGVVNIVVGFAPLKPAEFVVIQIQQLAGQIQV